MATIGLDKLFYAKITEDDNGGETYATPMQMAKAMSADLSVELAEATLYADDGAAEIVKEFKSGTLSLGVDDIASRSRIDTAIVFRPVCFDGDLAPNIPGVQISARSSPFDRVLPSSHSRSPEPYPAAECGCPTGRPRRNHKCSSRPYSRFSVPRSVPILSAFQYGSRSQFWASLILPPVQTGSSHDFARPRYK